MQDQPNAPVQRAILGLVLDAHPKSLTIPELSREIGDEAEDAIRELVGVGLLEHSIRASAAALRFEGLELP